METGSLFFRGWRLPFVRAVTPTLTYHAYTLLCDPDAGSVVLQYHGNVVRALSDIGATDDVYGFRLEGTNEAGDREAWKVSYLSCGCGRSAPVPSRPDEVPAQPEKKREEIALDG